MNIASFEKISLQDYPGKISTICFMNACQLRCPYCHNPNLVLPEIYEDIRDETKDEFMEYLKKRKNMLEGVVISGGEPLMQKDLIDLLQEIKDLGLDIKLDTNGMLSESLQTIIDKKLVDYIALDYKGSESSFKRAVGLSGYSQDRALYRNWCQSLDIVKTSSLEYELRTTVVKEIHSKDVLIDMAEELKELIPDGIFKWYLQNYEESSDVLNKFTKEEKILSSYSKSEMVEIENILKEVVAEVSLRA